MCSSKHPYRRTSSYIHLLVQSVTYTTTTDRMLRLVNSTIQHMSNFAPYEIHLVCFCCCSFILLPCFCGIFSLISLYSFWSIDNRQKKIKKRKTDFLLKSKKNTAKTFNRLNDNKIRIYRSCIENRNEESSYWTSSLAMAVRGKLQEANNF